LAQLARYLNLTAHNGHVQPVRLNHTEPTSRTGVVPADEELLGHVYDFYQRQMPISSPAWAYLGARGIHNRALIERMRIGYAPGACLRGYLERLGYSRKTLLLRGLIDELGRDRFYRCLTFPLPETGSLYGRMIGDGLCRHRFLPASKGGLYGWEESRVFSGVVIVEGVFDVAALWQAGFANAVASLGSHLNNQQLAQLCAPAGRLVYICFDADRNGSGQRAAWRLSVQLRHASVEALRVELPCGQDPASFLAGGAGAADFERCLARARP
jgi:DNA primase